MGADRLLKAERKKYYNEFKNTISDISASEGINWHSIPPAAPNFGGLWEAGVKSI